MKTKLRIVINAFSIVFFLVPAFAFAFTDPTHADCSFLSVGSAPCSISTIDLTGGGVQYRASVFSGLYFDSDTTYYVSYTASGSGNVRLTFSGNSNDGTSVYVSGSQTDVAVDMTPSGENTSYNFFMISNEGGFSGSVSDVCITDHIGGCVAPVPLSGIAAVINNSTSSVENVTGFGMDSMALWSWINIGKPALGMGLGSLYVLRWHIFSLIALSIIIFFAFRYYGFFKH